MPETWNLAHRDNLLWQLAHELKKHTTVGLTYLKVTFFVDDIEIIQIYGAHVALDWIVNDIYFNEEANWSQANRLTVETY